jgi:hypothetical protein
MSNTACRLTGPNQDIDGLITELEALGSHDFLPQRPLLSSGTGKITAATWTCLPLRSPGGTLARTDPGGPSNLDYHWTRACPEDSRFRKALEGLPAPLRSVRLMSLAAGTSVDAHRDYPTGFAAGMIRLHLPITTTTKAVICIGDDRYHWGAGELWFGDFSHLHSVSNLDSLPRVHCVIDCEITPQLLKLFPEDFRCHLQSLEVLYHSPPVPLLGLDRELLPEHFLVPLTLLELDEPVSDRLGVVVATMTWQGLRPEMLVPGHGPVGLVHIGNGVFTLQGWYAERTIAFEQEAISFISRTGRARSVVRYALPATDVLPPDPGDFP